MNPFSPSKAQILLAFGSALSSPDRHAPQPHDLRDACIKFVKSSGTEFTMKCLRRARASRFGKGWDPANAAGNFLRNQFGVATLPLLIAFMRETLSMHLRVRQYCCSSNAEDVRGE